MKRDDRSIEDILRQSLPSAPRQPMEAALDRVAVRLRTGRGGAADDAALEFRQPRADRRWLPAVAAAAVLVTAIGSAMFWPRADRYVTNDAAQLVALDDGSRVEMRAHSELTVEPADDGLRIRLDRGGIIVQAAEQRGGHLYVQTADMTISVVGTVFLVDADDAGSRVAVIEGEVRVQQGAVETTLMRGDHLATNASVNAPPVSEAIAWSRNAPALLALLQQSTAVPPALSPQSPPEPRLAFDVASIRPSGVALVGGRGGAQRSPCSELFLDTARDGTPIFRVQVDPSRFVVTRTTLYTLIAWAYGKDCRFMSLGSLLSGGPGWVGSDEWDIQAAIPEGAAGGTARQFVDGKVPDLQARLRTLLAERFKLVVRSEMKDVAGFVLTRGKGPLKLRPRAEQTGPGAYTGRSDELGRYGVFMNVPESNFAAMLMLATNRPVLDRTGMTDSVYLDLEFAPLNGGPSPRPSLFTALEEVGLRLEEGRVPLEGLVIERVERPTDN